MRTPTAEEAALSKLLSADHDDDLMLQFKLQSALMKLAKVAPARASAFVGQLLDRAEVDGERAAAALNFMHGKLFSAKAAGATEHPPGVPSGASERLRALAERGELRTQALQCLGDWPGLVWPDRTVAAAFMDPRSDVHLAAFSAALSQNDVVGRLNVFLTAR